MMVQSPLLAATAIEHAYRQRCPAAVRGPSDRSVGTPWTIGLSMADFARQRLEAPAATPVVERCVASVRAAIAGYIEAGRAGLHIASAPAPSVSLSLHGLVDRRSFVRAARSLERLLKHTLAIVTLRIEALREADRRHLERLLRRLRRYGDRVSVDQDERLRSIVSIDSSVLHLVLAGAPRALRFGVERSLGTLDHAHQEQRYDADGQCRALRRKFPGRTSRRLPAVAPTRPSRPRF